MRKRRKMIPLMTDNSARSARPVGTGGQKGVFWQINPISIRGAAFSKSTAGPIWLGRWQK